MIPTRVKMMGWYIVEEYDFGVAGSTVYVGGKEVAETYDQAVARLEREA